MLCPCNVGNIVLLTFGITPFCCVYHVTSFGFKTIKCFWAHGLHNGGPCHKQFYPCAVGLLLRCSCNIWSRNVESPLNFGKKYIPSFCTHFHDPFKLRYFVCLCNEQADPCSIWQHVRRSSHVAVVPFVTYLYPMTSSIWVYNLKCINVLVGRRENIYYLFLFCYVLRTHTLYFFRSLIRVKHFPYII